MFDEPREVTNTIHDIHCQILLKTRYPRWVLDVNLNSKNWHEKTSHGVFEQIRWTALTATVLNSQIQCIYTKMYQLKPSGINTSLFLCQPHTCAQKNPSFFIFFFIFERLPFFSSKFNHRFPGDDANMSNHVRGSPRFIQPTLFVSFGKSCSMSKRIIHAECITAVTCVCVVSIMKRVTCNHLRRERWTGWSRDEYKGLSALISQSLLHIKRSDDSVEEQSIPLLLTSLYTWTEHKMTGFQYDRRFLFHVNLHTCCSVFTHLFVLLNSSQSLKIS